MQPFIIEEQNCSAAFQAADYNFMVLKLEG
jgi:hypothetical protein